MERPKPGAKPRETNTFVEDLIRERSLTMEDGRERGLVKTTQVPTKDVSARKPGPDDGDELG